MLGRPGEITPGRRIIFAPESSYSPQLLARNFRTVEKRHRFKHPGLVTHTELNAVAICRSNRLGVHGATVQSQLDAITGRVCTNGEIFPLHARPCPTPLFIMPAPNSYHLNLSVGNRSTHRNLQLAEPPDHISRKRRGLLLSDDIDVTAGGVRPRPTAHTREWVRCRAGFDNHAAADARLAKIIHSRPHKVADQPGGLLSNSPYFGN